MKALAIDLGGHKIAAALVDFDHGPPEIYCRFVTPTPESREPDDVLRALVKIIINMTRGDNIETVGVGLPGFIDKTRRRVKKLTNFAKFENVNFVEDLEKLLIDEGLPIKVFIENDANCFAVGEGVCGAAQGCDDYVVVTLGTGIGGGIVVGGRLLIGAHGQAGEIGHITGLGGFPCMCGGFSHIETLAAADGIERLAGENGLPADFKLLWERRGEEYVRALLEPGLDALARCIASVSVVTDPEIIIINGGMSRADNLINELNPRVLKYLPSASKPNLKIEVSKLGVNAVFFGAASLSGNAAQI